MSRIDHLRLYGLPETSDRMAELLRDGPGAKWHGWCKKHIEKKKAAIRKRKLELGLEGGGSVAAGERAAGL